MINIVKKWETLRETEPIFVFGMCNIKLSADRTCDSGQNDSAIQRAE